jgi:hypothetical protein
VFGAIAQLGERIVRNDEVVGSIPTSSTMIYPFVSATYSLPVFCCTVLQRRQDVSIKCLLEQPAFDRFVFVVSVLEGYSDRDCALLLDCSCADVMAARIRAFQQIARRPTEMYSGYGSGASHT